MWREGLWASGPELALGLREVAVATKEAWRRLRAPELRHPECPDAIPIRQTQASSQEEGQCFSRWA